jgi:hypothetical protein
MRIFKQGSFENELFKGMLENQASNVADEDLYQENNYIKGVQELVRAAECFELGGLSVHAATVTDAIAKIAGNEKKPKKSDKSLKDKINAEVFKHYGFDPSDINLADDGDDGDKINKFDSAWDKAGSGEEKDSGKDEDGWEYEDFSTGYRSSSPDGGAKFVLFNNGEAFYKDSGGVKHKPADMSFEDLEKDMEIDEEDVKIDFDEKDIDEDYEDYDPDKKGKGDDDDPDGSGGAMMLA